MKRIASALMVAVLGMGLAACGGGGYDTSYQQDYPTYVYVHGQRTIVHHYHTVVVHHNGTRPRTSTGHTTLTKHTTTTTRTTRTTTTHHH